MSNTAQDDSYENAIVTREAYRTFVAFMFAAAMVGWGGTLLGLTSLEPPLLEIDVPIDKTLVAGLLYGCVLICFYWIYSEILAVDFLPTNLALLLLDFVALSFMTGAGASWRTPFNFNVLVTITLMLLVLRFGVASRSEIKLVRGKHLRIRDMLMTHILGVYFLCFIFLAGVVAGTGSLSSAFNRDLFYYLLMLGMLFGIIVTVVHSIRHIPIRLRVHSAKQRVKPTYEPDQPVLLPAYGVIADGRLEAVAKHVFLGEERFRYLLRSIDPEWISPFNFHQSRVHSYRDVETQAFVMAHHADNVNEIELRSMWVYLAHWFDDKFDGEYAANLARGGLGKDFNIVEVLRQLDNRFGRLWEVAVNQTASHHRWNRGLLETGMRRLILSGPMFSSRCDPEHDAIGRVHRDLVIENLDENYGVKQLIQNISPRYLKYTSKVVVEIWDSFNPLLDFNISMLMNLLYAPGLFYHDADAEHAYGEIKLEPSDEDPTKFGEILDTAFDLIDVLPDDKRQQALKPVSMFVRSFAPIFDQRGLKGKYQRWLR